MSAPDNQKRTLYSLITSDPGLPRPFTKPPYWLHMPCALAQHQSPSLHSTVDVIVIGSGITGASVAHTLLESDPTISVTLLEARSLCSGATGRNGGHIVAYGGADFAILKEEFGVEEALKIIDFTFSTLDDLVELVRQNGWEKDVEYRPVTRVKTFGDEDTLLSTKKSVAEFSAERPMMDKVYRFIGPEKAAMDHGIQGATGALLFPAHAIWPYKLVSKVFERLVGHYPSRFYLETNTPALSIAVDDTFPKSTHPYVVTTPRGSIQTTHVVHATNGYAGHLIPELRGRLYPYRGSMTVQNFKSEISNQGDRYTWSHHHKPRYDPASGTTIPGTYYLQQNANSGYFFFGGERTTPDQSINTDDTQPVKSATKHLESKLTSLLGQDPQSRHTVSEWAGVMGYTADKLPLVGRIPSTVSARHEGEWISAGFNGMGMCYAWRAGKGVAKMILGEDVSGWLPKSFVLSEERLKHRLVTEASLQDLKG
ncbi:uncharacterized protein N7503_003328 [Penicillium pulvis]|uniref:uncharacterized protein n=1 Tax=Penicillium pulvis TaxID=1562058 RepID=UPI00254769FF|nr:uncharacterized protein N7503_003328 [Penicillium pulvis]KAJ5805726.1 hypothetical protein N7503_003328 [Penicillium pulvis]